MALRVCKRNIYSPKRYDVGDTFKILFGNVLPDLSVGSGNLQAISQGKAAKPSVYIQHAAQRLSCGFQEVFKNRAIEICEEPDKKSFEQINDGLFLGGPLANSQLAHYLGYDLIEKTNRSGDKSVFLPRASKNFSLRFESFHGEGALGEFDGALKTAKRWDGGKEVERPMFALKDHQTGKIIHCEKKGDFLANEYFQIVKRRDQYGRLKVFMWGFHGHSLQGFMSDENQAFKRNMNELVARVEGMQEFQAVIPMSYEQRKADGPYIHALAQWDDAIVHRIR